MPRISPLVWYGVLWALERAPDHRLRTRAKADRRGAYAVVRRKGRDMQRKMWPVQSAAIKDLFVDYIDNNEASVIAAVLQRVLNAARE